MKILLDTSVLVAALVESHTFHELAFDWLEKARDKKYDGLVSAHSLAELYAILTRLPVQPTISPKEAQQLIKTSVIDVFETVPLLSQDYASVIEYLAALGIIGGAVYDGLIMYAAAKANADLIVTLNEKDFRRVYPELCNGQTHLEQQHYIGLGKKRIEKARNPLFSPSVVVFRLHKMLLTLTVYPELAAKVVPPDYKYPTA